MFHSLPSCQAVIRPTGRILGAGIIRLNHDVPARTVCARGRRLRDSEAVFPAVVVFTAERTNIQASALMVRSRRMIKKRGQGDADRELDVEDVWSVYESLSVYILSDLQSSHVVEECGCETRTCQLI